jgi:hypothetical protein
MEPEQVCKEMAGELEDAARWLAEGGLSEREFQSLLDILEKRKLTGSGFKLTGFRAGDGGVHFTLRSAADTLWRVMDVDPKSGKLITARRVGRNADRGKKARRKFHNLLLQSVSRR